MPGDKLGVEEEFAASENTYVDSDGTVRAAIIGYAKMDAGQASVTNPNHDIKNIQPGMTVIGTITDDVRAVMFVKIDTLKMNGKEFIALKDGKIILPKDRGPPRRSFDRDNRGPPRPPAQEEKEKLCNVGDVILAKVLDDEQDTYVLGIRDRECGIIFANCELCGTHMQYENEKNALVCPDCKHMQRRKVSSYYDKPEEIKRLFA